MVQGLLQAGHVRPLRRERLITVLDRADLGHPLQRLPALDPREIVWTEMHPRLPMRQARDRVGVAAVLGLGELLR